MFLSHELPIEETKTKRFCCKNHSEIGLFECINLKQNDNIHEIRNHQRT